MRRCDDRPPLLEEPFAQTLSGKKKHRAKKENLEDLEDIYLEVS